MLLYPKYAENIVVGIVRDTGFEWYVTDCDAWILDINKYGNAFEENGFPFDRELALSIRGEIDVVNEDTIDTYLLAYQENLVSTTALKELVRGKKYTDTILSLKPSLYIDFTENNLLSLFPELIAFEKYVPAGWMGSREDFTRYIPDGDRYWIVDGIDAINEEFKKEREEFKGEA